jgi:hypothetical protein
MDKLGREESGVCRAKRGVMVVSLELRIRKKDDPDGAGPETTTRGLVTAM